MELSQWTWHSRVTKTSEEDKVKFLQEAAIMAQFRHPNVIMLYGVIAKEEPVSYSNIHCRGWAIGCPFFEWIYFSLLETQCLIRGTCINCFTQQMTLVVELAQNGDLREFLLSMRPE